MTRSRALLALVAPLLIAAGLGLRQPARASVHDGFASFDAVRWLAPDHALGRGDVRAAGVTIDRGMLALRVSPASRRGAEVKTHARYGAGRFAVRLQAADAPGSVTGFFLYRAPDLASEIEVEIPNDHSRRVLLTTYSAGRITHRALVGLGFDATRTLHTYSFERAGAAVRFRADGRLLKVFRGGVPRTRMSLYLNAWFPRWLEGESTPSAARSATVADWVELPR